MIPSGYQTNELKSHNDEAIPVIIYISKTQTLKDGYSVRIYAYQNILVIQTKS